MARIRIIVNKEEKLMDLGYPRLEGSLSPGAAGRCCERPAAVSFHISAGEQQLPGRFPSSPADRRHRYHQLEYMLV